MASDLTPADVERIAALARLSLSGEESTQLARDLGRILEFARQIAALDTRSVSASAAFLGVEPLEREDVPRTGLTTQEALANAPEVVGGLFVVPRVPGHE